MTHVTLTVGGVDKLYIRIHYVKSHPTPDPDIFDIRLDPEQRTGINYFDAVEIRKNGVLEYYGFVEEITPELTETGLEFLLTGRCWKLIVWKKYTERYIETRGVGPLDPTTEDREAGFFGKVYPHELLQFLLRCPVSTHPEGTIRHKIGWGIPSINWTCTASRTAMGHSPVWVATRHVGFEWQLGSCHLLDELIVDNYIETSWTVGTCGHIRDWYHSTDTPNAINGNYFATAWVNNETGNWIPFGGAGWNCLGICDTTNYLTASCQLGLTAASYWTFDDIAGHLFLPTLASCFLRISARLYAGAGGVPNSVTLELQLHRNPDACDDCPAVTTNWFSLGTVVVTGTGWATYSLTLSNFLGSDWGQRQIANNAALRIIPTACDCTACGGCGTCGGVHVDCAWMTLVGTSYNKGGGVLIDTDDGDTQYIEGWDACNLDGYYHFDDIVFPPECGRYGGDPDWRPLVGHSISLRVKGRNVILAGAGANVSVDCYIEEEAAAGYTNVGTVTFTTADVAYTNKTIGGVESLLDTLAKVNYARIMFRRTSDYSPVGANESRVRFTYVYLVVEITEASTQGAGDWFEVDMGEEYDNVTAILIESRNDITESQFARHFDIQLSDTGAWAGEEHTARAIQYNFARDILLSFPPVNNVRYIRIYITQAAPFHWEISQIYIWQGDADMYRVMDEPEVTL